MSPTVRRNPVAAEHAEGAPPAGEVPRGHELIDRDDWLSRVGEVARALRVAGAPIADEHGAPDADADRRRTVANR